jgi:large subunit ribosomal protein L13
LDVGDHVVVINCEKVKVTGRKTEEIKYYRFAGYPGGLNVTDFDTMLARHPERVIEHAVKGMLPKTKLGRKMIKKLHVYAGSDHPHAAQQPEALEV